MARNPRAYLRDALDAANYIQRVLVGRTREEYEVNEDLQAIVERKLITIGEALGQARADDASFNRSIRNLRRIVGMRNFVVHVNHAVSNETVWDVCHKDLDELVEDLHALLGES